MKRAANRNTPLSGPITSSTAVCLLFTAPAHAQTAADQMLEQGGLSQTETPDRWNVALGAGPALIPRYLGARNGRAGVVPLISISYGGTSHFFVGPFGLGFAPINWGEFHAGPILGLTPRRPESADSHLAGLGDISSSAAAGAFALYRWGHFIVIAAVEQAITHTGNGAIALAQINYHAVLVPRRLDMTIGPEVELGNRAHEQTWFGVTPGQSGPSGLPEFTPGAGLTDAGAHVNFNYHYSRHIVFRLFADGKELTGSVADSPIVERRLQALVGAGIAYQF